MWRDRQCNYYCLTSKTFRAVVMLAFAALVVYLPETLGNYYCLTSKGGFPNQSFLKHRNNEAIFLLFYAPVLILEMLNFWRLDCCSLKELKIANEINFSPFLNRWHLRDWHRWMCIKSLPTWRWVHTGHCHLYMQL